MATSDTAPRGKLRRFIAIVSLSFGGFAIGASEFVAMGLLPEIAVDTGSSVPGTAAFIWVYALGVVIGAPVAGVLSKHFSQGRFLAVSLGVMGLLTGLTALMPGFAAVLGTRVASALPHAAYFGVGGMVASRLLGQNHAARGVAVVLGGLTVANVVGTPAATRLGQAFGWRVVYLLIAGIFIVAATGVAWSLWCLARPQRDAPQSQAQFSTFTEPELWRNVVVFALVNAGSFAVVSFTAPIVTDVAVMPATAIPTVLLLGGVGMTTGNYLGGAITDQSHRAAAFILIAVSALPFAALLIPPFSEVTVYIAFFFAGYAIGAASPLSQVRLMYSVPSRPQIGSSMNSFTGNFGSMLGTLSATISINATGGFTSVAWVGLSLVIPGWAGLVMMLRRQR